MIKIPNLLEPTVAAKLTAFTSACALSLDELALQQLSYLFACSQFVADNLIQHPQLYVDIFENDSLKTTYTATDYQTHAERYLPLTLTEEELIVNLRHFRRREMLRIAIRDLLHLASLNDIVSELSAFADCTINKSLDILHHLQCQQLGEPRSPSNHPQYLIVLAVGKLGTYELNFSSDIDLIFCYEGAGHTHGKANTLSSEQFFHRLGQRLINVLSKASAAGPGFRVDMRLRPYGSGGPLVTSIASMASYYQEQGREWERFALAKARLVNHSVIGQQLLETIHQFVYRRYVDYSVIESLRQMKQMIRRESQGLENNIKRGEGGIREVEFIGQVFQLIRGGQEPWLREPRILKILPLLQEKNCLPTKGASELIAAYEFLRITEHRLQEYNDQQTQALPKDENQQASLALSLGFEHWDLFISTLDKHRKNVIKHFNKMISPPKKLEKKALVIDENLLKLMYTETSDDEAFHLLSELGFIEAKAAWALLKDFYSSFNYRSMDAASRKRLHALLQQLLPLLAESKNNIVTSTRVIRLLEAIVRRSTYLVLLLENPTAMLQLVELCSASPWIADQLIQLPFLLDELLDSETLYIPYDVNKIHDQLRQYMLSLPANDLEQQMDCLRRFKHTQVLRVAASDIKGVLPLMKVSDHLSNTATAIVGYAQRLAWGYLTARHGFPLQHGEQLSCEDFAIIAYGKLGGLELGYGSDLDLVFLHDAENIAEMTNGDKAVSCSEFYLRLAQRIIHILNVATPSGNLYEVDIRLRPSGGSGLLVSSIHGFINYQRNEAWTWEHQALVRARVISGSKSISTRFQTLRQEILGRQRDDEKLKQEINSMRKKMRDVIRKSSQAGAHQFDVDQGEGGIKDIEFIVQYGVLRWGHLEPKIFHYTDNIRILESFAEYNLMVEEEVKLLSDAYCRYREIVHRRTLQNDPPWIGEDALLEYREGVKKIWDRLFTRDS